MQICLRTCAFASSYLKEPLLLRVAVCIMRARCFPATNFNKDCTTSMVAGSLASVSCRVYLSEVIHALVCKSPQMCKTTGIASLSHLQPILEWLDPFKLGVAKTHTTLKPWPLSTKTRSRCFLQPKASQPLTSTYVPYADLQNWFARASQHLWDSSMCTSTWHGLEYKP